MSSPMIPTKLAMSVAAHERLPAVVTHTGTTTTYGQWWEVVLSWAAVLRERVPVRGRVTILLDRSLEAVVVMAACLLAGRPYVPVDPRTPTERLRRILADCQAEVLISHPRGLDRVSGELPPQQRPAVLLDATTDPPAAHSAPAEPGAGPDDDASIIYTSGSTGVPKGVRISHRNLAAFVDWAVPAFALGPDDRLPVLSPLYFDIAVLDVFGGLTSGATLHPVEERMLLFPSALRTFLAETRITVAYAVPSLYAGLLLDGGLRAGDLPSLRCLLYAGEEFHVPLLRRLHKLLPAAELHNLYGPVETNVVASHRVSEADLMADHVPVGTPASGAAIVLWDDDRGKVAQGETGEIVVAGPTVSPGYLNNPERTAASRFTVPGDGRSFFRTGDFGMLRQDGSLLLHGRGDHMIKSQGVRIEPGDVEAALLQHPEVNRAVAFAVPDGRSSHILHAAVMLQDGAQAEERQLRGWCAGQLPASMVPSRVSVVGEIPLTSTGKVDRRTLTKRLSGDWRA